MKETTAKTNALEHDIKTKCNGDLDTWCGGSQARAVLDPTKS